jgi:hypothetical protein
MDPTRVNPESVAWAQAQASSLLDGERERLRSLNERAIQLAGFASVVLAVLGGFAYEGFAASLAPFGEITFAAFYFTALIALAATILWVLTLVYRPRSYTSVGTNELRHYLENPALLEGRAWALQLRTMHSLYLAARWTRRRASRMAEGLRIAALLFGAGLICVVGATVTLGIGAL